jgi:ligand-binding SRPBCC domain-containing protein
MVKLKEVTTIYAPVARCFDLARSVEAHLAGNVHFGEQAVATGGATTGLIELNQRVTWRAKHFWVWHNLTSEISAMEPPVYFQDVMVKGIFRFMWHDHYFHSVSPHETRMEDVFCFAAQWPLLGHLAEVLFLRRYMQTLLRERNTVLKQIAESPAWQHYLPSL